MWQDLHFQGNYEKLLISDIAIPGAVQRSGDSITRALVMQAKGCASVKCDGCFYNDSLIVHVEASTSREMKMLKDKKTLLIVLTATGTFANHF